MLPIVPPSSSLAALTHYCQALTAELYRGLVLSWGLATLDTGAEIIHVFDARRGITVRTIQPTTAGGWEILGRDEELLEAGPDLERLILRATAMLVMDVPDRAALH